MTNENFGFLAPDPDHCEDGASIKRQIKLWMAANEIESLAELARLIDVKREELSMCVHQHQYRTYPNIRRKLAFKMGVSYEKLWGTSANTAANRRRATRQEARRAA